MTDINPMPRLIKTAKKVFCDVSMIISDVYYDRVLNVYIIKNFPTEGDLFEVGVPMEDGFAEIKVNDKKYRVRIYEK